MTKRAMIDFEAFGNGKNACVCQIGACYFGDGEIGERLRLNVNAESATRNGAEIDASTIYWWLSQSPEAIRSILSEPRMDEIIAFETLNIFLSTADEIWSHATYDFVILMETLKRLGIKPKFGYRAARDIRALNALSPFEKDSIPREGTHHDGLDGAIYQARYVMAQLVSLKNLGVPV